jgi:hypothetical protein
MKANEKRWFWVLIILLAILTPIMNHFIKYGYFISLLIIIIALNATKELRQDFIKHWIKYRKLNIICLAIILVCLVLNIFLFK